MKNLIQFLVLFLSMVFFSACTEYYYDAENGSRITELEDKLEDSTSKNGSRIIFREILMEDGSVYQDNRPFDTLYNRICQIEEDDTDHYSDNGVDVYIGVLNGCCTSFGSDPDLLFYKFSEGHLYSDSECTSPLETDYTIHKDTFDLFKEGSFFKKSFYELTHILRVESILKNTSVYFKYGEDCQLTEILPAIVEKLTIEETRGLFVCKAEAEER